MDRRKFILGILNNHKGFDKQEEQSRQEIIRFVSSHKECFQNDFRLGHITGSAFVVDRKMEYTLLTHHIHLNRWFQFGGHSDGDWNSLEVAWREAHEESGLTTLEYVPGWKGIFDVDVHNILPREDMPEHKHYDVRILLTADMSEPYIISHESHDLQWIKLEEARKYNTQHAFLRLVTKVKRIKTYNVLVK